MKRFAKVQEKIRENQQEISSNQDDMHRLEAAQAAIADHKAVIAEFAPESINKSSV